jgi:beta-lactamase regulating signal transducer with metallopeptidase domain
MSIHYPVTSKLLALSDMFGIDVIHALVWSLLHSLWQAGAVSLCLATVMGFIPNTLAAMRYRIYVVGTLTCLIASVVTFFSYFQKSVLMLSLNSQGRMATYIPLDPHTNWLAQLSVYVNLHLSQIIFCWSAGFILICGKSIWHWYSDRRLALRETESLPAHWETQFSALIAKMRLRNSVQFRLSKKINVPSVVGYFRPIVLLPASLLLGMSPQQIEAIILHELAHIRRHDILLANLQNVMKALYFFNPFVFWISAKLDQERENACDDIAVSICHNPLLYAQSLHHFAEMQSHFLSTTTALTGRKNMLHRRIQRLFISTNRETHHAKKIISAALLLSLGITTAAYAWMQIDSKNTVNLSANNLPLKQFLLQAENVCPGSAVKVKLRQPELAVTANFANFTCADVPALFGDMEERFGMKFTDVQFSTALDIFKQQCPTVFRQVTLKNPDALYSTNKMDVTCLDILAAVAEFDAKL